LTISRALVTGNLGNLVLPTSTIDFSPIIHEGVHWDRSVVQSPFTDGRYLTGIRKQPTSISTVFFIDTAADGSPAVHDAAVAALIAALSQFTFTITHVTTAGEATQTNTWACEPADLEPGPVSLSQAYKLRKQLIKATIPVHPSPTAGAW
jgi:hypothetical protein